MTWFPRTFEESAVGAPAFVDAVLSCRKDTAPSVPPTTSALIPVSA